MSLANYIHRRLAFVRPFDFPSEDVASDWIHLSRHNVANWSPTSGQTYSGAGNGVEVGNFLSRYDNSIVNNAFTFSAPGTVVWAGMTTNGVNASVFGQVAKVDASFSGTPSNGGTGVAFPTTQGGNYTTANGARLHSWGGPRWISPAPDTNAYYTEGTALEVDFVNQDAFAFMFGGYRTPYVGGLMSGDIAISKNDATAIHGSRCWVRDSGVWTLAYIFGSSALGTRYMQVHNNDTIPRNVSLIADDFKIPTAAFLYPELMFNTAGLIEQYDSADDLDKYTVNAAADLPYVNSSGFVIPNGQCTAVKEFGWSDGIIYATMNRGPFEGPNVILRYQDANNYLGARHWYSGGFYNDVAIYEVVGGVYTQLGMRTSSNTNRGATDMVVSFRGPIIAATWGAGTITVSTTRFQNETKHGLGSRGAGGGAICYHAEFQPETDPIYQTILDGI